MTREEQKALLNRLLDGTETTAIRTFRSGVIGRLAKSIADQ